MFPHVFRIDTLVNKMSIFGHGSGMDLPIIVTSTTSGDDSPLLSVCFETNPLNDICDQKLRVHTEPLEIVYHAVS